jgi:hypothetical protein
MAPGIYSEPVRLSTRKKHFLVHLMDVTKTDLSNLNFVLNIQCGVHIYRKIKIDFKTTAWR